MIRAAVLLVWRWIDWIAARREVRRREAERRAEILDLVLKVTPTEAPLSPLLYGLRPLDPEHPKPPSWWDDSVSGPILTESLVDRPMTEDEKARYLEWFNATLPGVEYP